MIEHRGIGDDDRRRRWRGWERRQFSVDTLAAIEIRADRPALEHWGVRDPRIERCRVDRFEDLTLAELHAEKPAAALADDDSRRFHGQGERRRPDRANAI